MRLPEQRLWDSMRTALGPFYCLKRVENLVDIGFPDVMLGRNDYIRLIELKAQEDPPVRRGTRVFGPKGPTIEQRNWHLEWQRWGNFSHFILGIGRGRDRIVLLVPGKFADDISDATYKQLLAMSDANGWIAIRDAFMENATQ